ncbi:AzlC family ABC transporter permease [Kaistia dalseonensis]|uniref:4-azaleucine resistance transporter AzlC n=1 Tax=Kaistia dalseonensis TaxID=410840 RepID=A0ABU0HE69_9HYPH|nr:AzlC family ABC transporter permease [Kaistia dalseonensis]MCX5497167.1 AzlC family ABC transporter permease [Kaistia dalseonensis]MDQ0439796.1 4-azaleucine resistance transporter AzlC [Kaistia dalseonensis]
MSGHFTSHGFRRGFLEGIGLLPGMVAFGAVFGVVAGQIGISVLGAATMSTFVFAGTAQLLALHSWGAPDLVIAVVVAVVAMNARYILFGAAIQPWMRGVSPWIAYSSLFFLVDPNWAVAMRERDEGRHDVAVFVGMGLACMVGWVAGSIVGAGFGQLLGDTRRLGLDFFLPAFFLSLACGFWKGREDILPLVVGGFVAVIFERFVGGSWHVLAGGLAGSLVAAFRPKGTAAA